MESKMILLNDYFIKKKKKAISGVYHLFNTY